MKRSIAVIAMALVACAASANATIIAGWAQNDNELLPEQPGVFGFRTTSFPQAADFGSGSYSLADFDGTTDATFTDTYTKVASFSGTTVNDLQTAGSGGSFSFVGDTNNGAKSVWSVPTAGYEDIIVSWAQRGTSTGYTSRVFEYSTDGGSNWTDIGAFTGSAGALSSTWNTVSLDLSAVTALDNNAGAMFRITYDGASSATGNNRWDNFYVEGTVVPEPASLALLAMGGLAMLRRRR